MSEVKETNNGIIVFPDFQKLKDDVERQLLTSEANALYTQLVSNSLLSEEERAYFKEIRSVSRKSSRLLN